MNEIINLNGAVAVVTGAGNGIGRSISLALARQGADIVASDIVGSDAEAVAAEVIALGQRAIGVSVDVSDPDAVQLLADRAYEEFGHVDILVNNAGVTMRPFRTIWDASVEDYRWMTDVNYLGVVWGLRAFIPRMREQSGRKHIVNTSSMAALGETPGHGAYAAAKTAVTAISDQLRSEFRDYEEDFGVTVLHPGKVKTRIIETSEEFRSPEDRSDARDIPQYRYVRKDDEAMHVLIDPEIVGTMVVEAILADAPYVLTHAPSEDYLQARLSWALKGHESVLANHDERKVR